MLQRTPAIATSSGSLFVVLVTLVTGTFVLSSAGAQQNDARKQTGSAQDSLTQNFLNQHEIGRRFRVDPTDLPPPKTAPIVTNRSLIVPYSGQVPQVPPGFTATPFATGLVNPRRLLILPNGDVLVAEQSAGYITLLRDDGSGHATWIDRHVEDLNRPYGLAWQGNHVLVADQAGIWSVPHNLGALRAGSSAVLRVDQVPPDERKPTAGAYGATIITKKGAFGIVQGHQNRHLAIDPKTGALFVGVPLDQAEAVVMTLPHLLARAVRRRTGNGEARYVFGLHEWAIESTNDDNCLIATLKTTNGFEVSFGIPFEACQSLGRSLQHGANEVVEASEVSEETIALGGLKLN